MHAHTQTENDIVNTSSLYLSLLPPSLKKKKKKKKKKKHQKAKKKKKKKKKKNYIRNYIPVTREAVTEKQKDRQTGRQTP